MEEKKQNTNNPQDSFCAERLAAKKARMQAKNERIKARSERIARRNATLLHSEKSDVDPNVELTQNSAAETQKNAEISQVKVNVDKPTANTPRPRKKKHTAMNAAMILSSVSIILLLALFFSISFGLISIDGIKVVYLNLANKSPASQNSFDSTSEMIEDFKSSVVIVSAELVGGSGTGTGIIVSSDGYIVTNYHVVDEATNVYVKLYKSDGYAKAELVGYSKHDDIAVLKIEREGLRAASFASNCADFLAGERVFAIGSPDGADYSWSVTQGIISAVNREIKFYGSDGVMTKKWRVMQTDTPVNPGNSGGPLIDSNGTVVGIVTSKLENNEGMGFALPADGAIEIIAAIIEKGSADHIKSSISSGRPLIGVTCVSVEANVWYKNTDLGIEPVSEPYAIAHPDTTFFPKEDGVYVKFTDPARDAHGKLLPGDIITEVNGTRVYTQYQLMDELYNFHGGDNVSIKYYRDGEYFDVNIILTEAEIE